VQVWFINELDIVPPAVQCSPSKICFPRKLITRTRHDLPVFCLPLDVGESHTDPTGWDIFPRMEYTPLEGDGHSPGLSLVALGSG